MPVITFLCIRRYYYYGQNVRVDMWGGGEVLICTNTKHVAWNSLLSELVRLAGLLVIILLNFSCFLSMLSFTACLSDIGISNALSRR